jgi:Cu2+-exporting ATPase
VDGLVHEGAGQLNRSALTGESQAHPTTHGEHVEAGCVLISGHLTLIAQQVGDATRLGQLMAWIDSRQQERPKSIDRADRLSAWFVLIVLGAAALAWGLWSMAGHAQPLEIAVSVLVITCPCALGMATPLMLAMSGARAARRGIFIKHDYTLEQCAQIDTVVFDKTGVLTFGQPRVVDTLGDVDALEWARALESRSGHPLAQAIGRKARALNVQVINETPGAGIEGVVEGHHVIAGRPQWVWDQVHGVEPEHGLAQACQDWMTRGDSVVLCAIDGTPRALFGLRDPMRPEAPSIIQTLHDRGLETIILSGDHPHAVEHLARPLGVTQWYGGTSPEQKLEQVLELQAQGRQVMMVGDGVNDAAALQQAHVGVAVFGGTQASLAAADVFLTHEGIGAIATLLQGAQRTSRALDGLVLYAVLYNIAGLFAACFGHISPLMAAIFMPLSSLTLLLATWGASRAIMTAPSGTKPSSLDFIHSKTEVLS